MILKILERTNLRPTIIFCEDEEIGGVGSRKFTNTKFIKDLEKMYFLIELDRKGSEDLVYYSDENEDFHKYLEDLTEYSRNYGSFSDISNLSPVCKVSSVNISCGYYNAHTTSEYVVLEEMENSIKTTIKIIEDALKRKEKFEYKERTYQRFTSYNSKEDDYDYYYPSAFRNFCKGFDKKKENKEITLYVLWMKNGVECDDSFYGTNEKELWYEFFTTHSDVCMNDVIDYDVYDEDDYAFYTGQM